MQYVVNHSSAIARKPANSLNCKGALLHKSLIPNTDLGVRYNSFRDHEKYWIKACQDKANISFSDATDLNKRDYSSNSNLLKFMGNRQDEITVRGVPRGPAPTDDKFLVTDENNGKHRVIRITLQNLFIKFEDFLSAFSLDQSISPSDLQEGECTPHFAIVAVHALHDAIEKSAVYYYASREKAVCDYSFPSAVAKGTTVKGNHWSEILAATFGTNALPTPTKLLDLRDGITWCDENSIASLVAEWKNARKASDPDFIAEVFDLSTGFGITLADLLVAGLRESANKSLFENFLQNSYNSVTSSKGITYLAQVLSAVAFARDNALGIFWLRSAQKNLGCLYQVNPGDRIMMGVSYCGAPAKDVIANLTTWISLDVTLDFTTICKHLGFDSPTTFFNATLRTVCDQLEKSDKSSKATYDQLVKDIARLAPTFYNPGLPNYFIEKNVQKSQVDACITTMTSTFAKQTYVHEMSITLDSEYDSFYTMAWVLAPVELDRFGKKGTNKNQNRGKRQRGEEDDISVFPGSLGTVTPTRCEIRNTTRLIVEVVDYATAVKRWTVSRNKNLVWGATSGNVAFLQDGQYYVLDSVSTASLTARFPGSKASKDDVQIQAGGADLSAMAVLAPGAQLTTVMDM